MSKALIARIRTAAIQFGRVDVVRICDRPLTERDVLTLKVQALVWGIV
jgi:hypothetical protein